MTLNQEKILDKWLSIGDYLFCRLTSGIIITESWCMILTPAILQISFAQSLSQKHVTKQQSLEQEMQRYTYLLPLSFFYSFVFPVILGLSSTQLLISLQVRVFNMSRLSGRRPREISMEPTAVYQCHSRRVKKLAVSQHADGALFRI